MVYFILGSKMVAIRGINANLEGNEMPLAEEDMKTFF
jgi:hypothetical protein